MPVVLVTGDDVAVAQVKEVATAARGVVVKRAINVRAAELRSLREARKRSRRGARRVAGAKKIPADRPSSVRVRMRYRNFTYPEIATAFPAIRQIEPDTIEFTADTMPAAYRLIRVCTGLYPN